MPDLRSGVRRSKRINDIQENAAALVPATRRGAGRGDDSKAQAIKSPSPKPYNPAFFYPRPRPAGRGRGARAMNQDKNGKLFGTGVGGRGRVGLDLAAREVVTIPDEVVAEKGAEKLAAVEEEGSASPLPEKVLLLWSILILSISIGVLHYYYHLHMASPLICLLNLTTFLMIV